MALLCRHDIPLFWAGHDSAGEKQYYVVALMDSFIAHLPLSWTIGFMYDIACQIHASYLHRLRFAVSVFHAYGHDWPCQLVYHPRKRVGFGLTDGEGRLIPYLRVAGVSGFMTV
ncbi:hypothetical protein BD626DRAFT_551281 [Schizophyllum amplum]|uniref:Uncharacterized protein n=1 Tax=Schizophyllum amplum TaxID=97359 RepID=A0A550BWK7_9AGAR|nr:hypothetical protein BD626DRAFT_551281 [Auriculariopsis ampla]